MIISFANFTKAGQKDPHMGNVVIDIAQNCKRKELQWYRIKREGVTSFNDADNADSLPRQVAYLLSKLAGATLKLQATGAEKIFNGYFDRDLPSDQQYLLKTIDEGFASMGLELEATSFRFTKEA